MRIIARLVEVKATDKEGQTTISLKLETKPQAGLTLGLLEGFIGIGTLRLTFEDIQGHLFGVDRDTGEIR